MPFISLHSGRADASFPSKLLPLWQKLALTTGQADPVCCGPAWNLAFQEIFHPDCRIFYLAALDSLLLFCEKVMPLNQICLFPLESSWLFGQPLLGFYATELLKEAIEILSRHYHGQKPHFIISGIQKRRAESLKLYALSGSNYNFYNFSETSLCSASLEGGLDGWLGRRSANHRAKLRKALRKAQNTGIYFERVHPQSEAEGKLAYQRILDVEHRSWKGRGRCGMAESPSREFYERLLSHYIKLHMAYIIFARHDDADIGFVFGGTAGSVYRGQQFSYDQSYSASSIGNLLQLEKISWLCEMGVLRYDMGPISGPRMEYKSHWTEQVHDNITWLMRPI